MLGLKVKQLEIQIWLNKDKKGALYMTA